MLTEDQGSDDGREPLCVLTNVDIVRREDFYYCTISNERQLELGDTVSFQGQSLMIVEKHSVLHGGALQNRYRLGTERGFCCPYVENEQLDGLFLIGAVLKTSGNNAKLHFDIDKGQDAEAAHWFAYLSNADNGMHSMPKPGTKAILRIHSRWEIDSSIQRCYRTNGGSCGEMANPDNRYFTTEFWKRMGLLPDSLFFTSFTSWLHMDDADGISGITPCNVRLEGAEVGISSKRKARLHSDIEFFAASEWCCPSRTTASRSGITST